MWVQGESRDVNMMSVEISPEPTRPIPKDVQSLATRAWKAIHDKKGDVAELILDKALQRRPTDSSLAYNRAVAIHIQGREEEAMSLVREIHARDPDYLFARVKLAEEAIKHRDFGSARRLLDPLISRRRFHASEHAAMCHAYIELLVAEGETEGARQWLQMWKEVAPDDERAMYWHARLDKRGLLRRLFK